MNEHPFAEELARIRELAPLKAAIVELGLSGDRQNFKLTQKLFELVPGLKNA